MQTCENCCHSADYRESKIYIRCERENRSSIVRPNFQCKFFKDKADELCESIEEIYEGLANEDMTDHYEEMQIARHFK